MAPEITQAASTTRPGTDAGGSALSDGGTDERSGDGLGASAAVDASTAGSAAAGQAVTRAFFRWGIASYLAAVTAIVAAIVWWLGGAFVYVLDDPAIHLSIAERLAHDGTWGVTGGEFQSASSSPLWTLLIAAVVKVAPTGREWVPLALNLVAGVAVVAIFARSQRALDPDRRRPLDAATVVVLVVVALFLPGLALVGMEHTLHMALVVGTIAAVDHALRHDSSAPRLRLVYALVALAALTRFETAFVAVGLATALIVIAGRGATRRAIAVLGSAAVPIAGFAVVNKALGGGWLPNSVLAKGQATGTGAEVGGMGPVDITNRLTQDPLLVVLFLLAIAYLVLSERRSISGTLAAVTLVVTTVLHVALADIGWYERYQAYLVAIGIYLVLGLLAECPARLRIRATALLCLFAGLLALPKAHLIVQAPLAADDMHRHQYQAGRFLDRYYDGQPVATDQLGYISLFHDGPITDFAGLGDQEALRGRTSGAPLIEVWDDLARQRGFGVAVIYDVSAAFRVPDTWVHAGSWQLDHKPVTGVSDTLTFYATTTEELPALQQHLRDFEADMPRRVSLHLNELAELRALEIDDGASLTGLAEAAEPGDPNHGAPDRGA